MEIKPLAPLSRLLQILLKIDIAVTFLAVIVGLYNYRSYATFEPGIDMTEVLLPSDLLTALVGIVQLVVFIILGVTFLRWIFQTNKNLRYLSSQPMEFTPGWSIGWYFVPFANLYKPYQAMKEIWDVAHRSTISRKSILAGGGACGSFPISLGVL